MRCLWSHFFLSTTFTLALEPQGQLGGPYQVLETHFGVRPPFGSLRYTQDDREFRIAYTPEREAQLKTILERMKTFQAADEVHRNHSNPKKCKACSFVDVCEDPRESLRAYSPRRGCAASL
jgi:hypothetical protein